MYDDFETSAESGAPYELYEFVQGAIVWRFTTTESDLLYNERTYTASSIKRARITQGTDVFKDNLKLTFPRGNTFASQYLGFAPEETTTVTVLRGHVGDTDEDVQLYWKGRIIGVSASENTIDVEAESVFTSIKRSGLRAKYELTCRHSLYRTGCLVNREDFALDTVVNSIGTSTTELTIEEAALKDDGYYTGGMVLLTNGDSRFIVAHTGNLITLTRPLSSLVAGASIKVYAGCDRTITTCNEKFNNLFNFGGTPYIPTTNPFGGSSIA